jgi:hypothetical protein
MESKQPTDLITASEARRLLGVGPVKMAQLIKDKTLTCWTTPLDARKKLFSRAEVESLKAPRVEEAA